MGAGELRELGLGLGSTEVDLFENRSLCSRAGLGAGAGVGGLGWAVGCWAGLARRCRLGWAGLGFSSTGLRQGRAGQGGMGGCVQAGCLVRRQGERSVCGN